MKFIANLRNLVSVHQWKIFFALVVSVPGYLYEDEIKAYGRSAVEIVGRWLVGEMQVKRGILLTLGLAGTLTVVALIIFATLRFRRPKAAPPVQPPAPVELSALSDYEVLLLATLKLKDGSFVDIDELARALGVPKLEFRPAGRRLTARGLVGSFPPMVLVAGKVPGEMFYLTPAGEKFVIGHDLGQRVNAVDGRKLPRLVR